MYELKSPVSFKSQSAARQPEQKADCKWVLGAESGLPEKVQNNLDFSCKSRPESFKIDIFLKPYILKSENCKNFSFCYMNKNHFSPIGLEIWTKRFKN